MFDIFWKHEACKVATLIVFASLVVGLPALFFGGVGGFVGLLFLEILGLIFNWLVPPKDKAMD